MWRLWSKLFGWHYVAIAFGGVDHICRVRQDGDGRPFARVYDHHVDLKTTERRWVPLTFPRAAVALSPEAADVVVLPRKAAT